MDQQAGQTGNHDAGDNSGGGGGYHGGGEVAHHSLPRVRTKQTLSQYDYQIKLPTFQLLTVQADRKPQAVNAGKLKTVHGKKTEKQLQ